MIRVLLINPPSPERLGSPLLGQQYVAAALLVRGCEVRVVDAAARCSGHSAASIVEEAEAFGPDLIGMSLFTRWVWHAYRLAAELRSRFPFLVAGGAHATVRPEEALSHGFDAVLTGEGEISIVRLVDCLEARGALDRVPGLFFLDAERRIHRGPPAEVVADLDSLPYPATAQHLFDPRWYDRSGRVTTPGGVMTSRGCPARCTFCANYVTGRVLRHRSAANVIGELCEGHVRYGASFFPFWDDAITANRSRFLELCAGLEREIRFDLGWCAITRASLVDRLLLRAMKRAGCRSVNFGVESGDDEILRAVRKGITTGQVTAALDQAKEEGLSTACNFMLGFPQETPAALERTLRFMERISPLVDTFSTLGVVIPFPGTPMYEDYHRPYGFTDWWLREEYSRYTPSPPVDDFDRFYRHYIDDANLGLDFFRYSEEKRQVIRACMRFKAEHNLRAMGLLRDASLPTEPAHDRTTPPEPGAAP